MATRMSSLLNVMSTTACQTYQPHQTHWYTLGSHRVRTCSSPCSSSCHNQPAASVCGTLTWTSCKTLRKDTPCNKSPQQEAHRVTPSCCQKIRYYACCLTAWLLAKLVRMLALTASNLCLFLHFHTLYAIATSAETPTRHDEAMPIHVPTPSVLESAGGARAGTHTCSNNVMNIFAMACCPLKFVLHEATSTRVYCCCRHYLLHIICLATSMMSQLVGSRHPIIFSPKL